MFELIKPHVIAKILNLSVRTVRERTDWTISEVKKVSEATNIPVRYLIHDNHDNQEETTGESCLDKQD